MGESSLPKIAAAPTKVPATSTQYNAVCDALQGHQVMRDSAGDAEDGVSDIGRPSSGRPRKIYVSDAINVAGRDIDLDSISLQATGISSGKSKDSGYPNYLTPGGAGHDYFTIGAETTNLEMTIDGQAYTLEVDLQSDDLTLAPSSNNTCLVNDAIIETDPIWSKTIGEFGYWITIDTIGSEITALDGTAQCFKINNGAEDEVFIAEIDTANNRVIPITRGIGGTDRIAFSDGDTITLLKAHYIFLDNDLATIDTTTTYPTSGAGAPAVPATGDYHYYPPSDTHPGGGWYRYSGSSWEQLGRIYLGYAICDASDCLWVEHNDYNLAWNNILIYNRLTIKSTTECVLLGNATISVCGVSLSTHNKTIINITDLISGESLDEGIGYVYVDKNLNFYISSVCPRTLDNRLGAYHPKEYYRCVGLFLVGYGIVLVSCNYDPREGVLTLPSYTVVFSGFPASTNYELKISTGVSPLAKKVNVICGRNTTGGTQSDLYIKEVSAYTGFEAVYEPVAVIRDADDGGGLSSMYYHVHINFVSNGMIYAKYLGESFAYLKVYDFIVNL